jgi:nucleoside phosphorylase
LGLDVAFRSFQGEGGTLRVAVTWATDMGMVAASTAAIPLMEKYKPRCISMSGVCAGRQGKVELGDVIVADRLWTYDAGKLVREKDDDGKEVERFQGDVLTYNLLPDWKQRAERFVVEPTWSWLKGRPVSYVEQERWALGLALGNRLDPAHPERTTLCPDWGAVLQRLWARGMLAKGKLTLLPKGKTHIERERLLHPDGFGEVKRFAVHVGPIGTGNKVVEDPTIWSRLSESERKVLGLEMEACAIGAIAHAQVGRDVRAIVMKGVMDVANPDRDDRYKTFAARASAEVLLRFLRKHLEPAKHEPALEPPTKKEEPVAAVVQGPINLPVRRSEQELVGRDDLLLEVRRALADETTRGVALHGMSGVGKTSIAETIGATDHERGVYPGGVFEVSGLSESRFLSGLATVAGALGTPEAVEEEQKVAVARQRLAQATRRTLLVIDDLDPTAPWVERELRALPACVRILTTLTIWPSGFLNGPGRARWIEVPALAPAGASALVKSFASFLSDAEITKLNAFFVGHTLGLKSAANTLANEPMLGVDGYLDSIRAARELVPVGETGVERSALSALRVQWDHLPEAAQRAWAMCGAFGTAPVPDGWLRLALAEAAMNEADAQRGIGELVKRHLVARVIDGGAVSVRIHPLVHAFARSLAGPAERRAMATGISHWFDGTWETEIDLHLKARLSLPHVEAARQEAGGDPRVVRRLAVALRMNGRQESLDSATTMLRGVLSRARSDQTEETDAIEWVRHELALVLLQRGTGDELLEAEALLRSALRIRDVGTDTPRGALSVTLNDLGHVLWNIGGWKRLEEAEQLLRRALRTEETAVGGDMPTIASPMVNLSGVLLELGGSERLEEAEQLLRRAIRVQETTLGSDAPTIATTLSNLAMVLKDLGGHKRLEEAEQLLRRAIRIRERALGSDASSLGVTFSNLAMALYDLGGRERLEEAEQLSRRAVRMEETALGSDAPTLATTLNNLAGVLRDLGGPRRLAEAEQFLRRALAILRRAFPEESTRTAQIVRRLAAVLRQLRGQTRLREAQRLEASLSKGTRRTPTRKR